MKNTERINKDIIDDVREYLGLNRGDISKDDKINSMSPSEIFERWCEQNGFINYSETFRKVMGSIYEIDSNNATIKSKNQEDAFLIIGEILRMITSTENYFEEKMHEYICDKLDISDKYLDEVLDIVAKSNEKLVGENG